MKNNPIGIFDSGVGGLSVFSELVKLLPNEHYIYYGDTANLPYGDKTQARLVEITGNIFDFFKQKNVKAVVMACNTTSAMTYDTLKDNYNFKIYPIVQIVSKQIALKNYKTAGVFATKATIGSHAYKKEIQKYNDNCTVFEQACPDWVNIVENNLQEDERSIKQVKSDLDIMLTNNPEKIILGCTHYPYLMSVLTKYAPKDMFINPAEYFAKYIAEDLKNNDLLSNKPHKEPEFFVSANPKQFINASKLFYTIRNVCEIATGAAV